MFTSNKQIIESLLLLNCALVLGACTTQIQIQVPHSAVANFATCMKSPPTSYRRSSTLIEMSAITPVTLTNTRSLATGEDHLFVTNDVRGAMIAMPALDDTWADSLQSKFNATPSEIRAAADEADALWNNSAHQTFLKVYNELSKTGAPPRNLPSLNAGGFREYFRLLRSVSEKDGWGVLAARADAQLRALDRAPLAP